MRLSTALGAVACGVLFLGASTAFGDFGFVNADFAAGPVGFTTDYDFAISNTGPGQFNVTSTPSLWKAGLTNPSTSGQMLVADGATSAKKVWVDSVDLSAGTAYTVAFQAASLITGPSYANLGVWVKEDLFTQTKLASVVLDSNLGVWKSSTQVATFTPTVGGSYEFFIGNLNMAAEGNIFAPDNITVVPEPSSLALLGIGSLVGLGVYARRRRKFA